MPLSHGNCPDRTRCGTGRGHAGSGWKTGTLGLREAKGLSGGWSPWWSLDYNQINPSNKASTKTHTTCLIGIVSALSTSIAGSVAITVDPTLDGGSTGVKTPELLKEKNSVVTNRPQEFDPHLGLDSELLVLSGPSSSSTSKETTSLSFPLHPFLLSGTGVV